MATATLSAGAGVHVFGGRDASGFKRFCNVFADRILHLVHLALCFHVILGHGVLEKIFAMFLKLGNFRVGQLRALLLFVLQVFAAFALGLILFLRVIVAVERIDALANGLKFGLLQQGLAKLLNFLGKGVAGLSHC